MASKSQELRHGRQGWVLTLMLIALGATLSWFVGPRLHFLFDWSLPSYTDYFWGRRVGLFAHLAAGLVASGAGLAQLWLGFTGRSSGVHRVLGWIYAGAVALGCAGGIYLALTVPGHFAYASGLVFMAVAWALTTTMAVVTIRRRMPVAHRDWMLRSYTVTFAFVAIRLGGVAVHGLFSVPADPVADQIDTMMAWACWAVPLLAMDLAIQAQAVRQR